jgi:hypothetical protein
VEVVLIEPDELVEGVEVTVDRPSDEGSVAGVLGGTRAPLL